MKRHASRPISARSRAPRETAGHCAIHCRRTGARGGERGERARSQPWRAAAPGRPGAFGMPPGAASSKPESKPGRGRLSSGSARVKQLKGRQIDAPAVWARGRGLCSEPGTMARQRTPPTARRRPPAAAARVSGDSRAATVHRSPALIVQAASSTPRPFETAHRKSYQSLKNRAVWRMPRRTGKLLNRSNLRREPENVAAAHVEKLHPASERSYTVAFACASALLSAPPRSRDT
jgi:hypothetical protein